MPVLYQAVFYSKSNTKYQVLETNPTLCCRNGKIKIILILCFFFSIKRQLRRYEEGFAKDFGYKPSHADKMANKDIKRLCAELSRLKTNLTRKYYSTYIFLGFFQVSVFLPTFMLTLGMVGFLFKSA